MLHDIRIGNNDKLTHDGNKGYWLGWGIGYLRTVWDLI